MKFPRGYLFTYAHRRNDSGQYCSLHNEPPAKSKGALASTAGSRNQAGADVWAGPPKHIGEQWSHFSQTSPEGLDHVRFTGFCRDRHQTPRRLQRSERFCSDATLEACQCNVQSSNALFVSYQKNTYRSLRSPTGSTDAVGRHRNTLEHRPTFVSRVPPASVIGMFAHCLWASFLILLTIQRENTMNRRSLISISAATALGLALMGGNAVAQSAKDLVGT
jgi:hypothetical protein